MPDLLKMPSSTHEFILYSALKIVGVFSVLMFIVAYAVGRTRPCAIRDRAARTGLAGLACSRGRCIRSFQKEDFARPRAKPTTTSRPHRDDSASDGCDHSVRLANRSQRWSSRISTWASSTHLALSPCECESCSRVMPRIKYPFSAAFGRAHR
jgi:hypothetical protein